MKTILLLEQDGTANAPLTSLLREKGYRVIGAANGDAMLAILQDGPPVDIVIACLPVAAGQEQLAAVRERTPRLPMLYITSGPVADYVRPEQAEAGGGVPVRRGRRGSDENILMQDIGRRIRIALHASSGARQPYGRMHKGAYYSKVCARLYR